MPLANGCRESGVVGGLLMGWIGIASSSLTHSSACPEGEVVLGTLTSGKPPRSRSSLLFGGDISSFYRGSILFSYRFFNKDIFLSEILIMSCFLFFSFFLVVLLIFTKFLIVMPV